MLPEVQNMGICGQTKRPMAFKRINKKKKKEHLQPYMSSIILHNEKPGYGHLKLFLRTVYSAGLRKWSITCIRLVMIGFWLICHIH